MPSNQVPLPACVCRAHKDSGESEVQIQVYKPSSGSSDREIQPSKSFSDPAFQHSKSFSNPTYQRPLPHPAVCHASGDSNLLFQNKDSEDSGASNGELLMVHDNLLLRQSTLERTISRRGSAREGHVDIECSSLLRQSRFSRCSPEPISMKVREQGGSGEEALSQLAGSGGPLADQAAHTAVDIPAISRKAPKKRNTVRWLSNAVQAEEHRGSMAGCQGAPSNSSPQSALSQIQAAIAYTEDCSRLLQQTRVSGRSGVSFCLLFKCS